MAHNKKYRRRGYTALMNKLIARSGPRCIWCGVETVRIQSSLIKDDKTRDLQATIEHLVPKWMGGTYDSTNLVISCAACNRERGSRVCSPFKALFAK